MRFFAVCCLVAACPWTCHSADTCERGPDSQCEIDLSSLIQTAVNAHATGDSKHISETKVVQKLSDTGVASAVADTDVVHKGSESLKAGPRVGPDLLRATLLEASRVLVAANVSFAPMYGTLLQLVRDGNLLGADDDVDLLVPYEDYEKAKQALRGGFNGDAKVGFDEISKGIFFHLHYSSPKGTWAKLDIYADTGDEATMCVAWEEEAYARPEMETRQYLLNGMAVEQRVPKAPEQFVTLLYGPTWKTPLPKGAYSIVDSDGTFFNQNCPKLGVSAAAAGW